MSKRTEAGVMRQIIRACKAAGWTVTGVDNGGGLLVRTATEAEAMDEATATGQAHVLLERDGQRGWLFFVLGNCPEEVLNDYTTNLEDAVDPYLKTLEL